LEYQRQHNVDQAVNSELSSGQRKAAKHDRLSASDFPWRSFDAKWYRLCWHHKPGIQIIST